MKASKTLPGEASRARFRSADVVGQAAARGNAPVVGGVLRAAVLRSLPRIRYGRGCHTALQEIYSGWRGTTWFVEGDIAQCFDRLDQQVMRSILAEKIHDNRFLRLVDGLLQAGYLEQWRYHATLSGSPQGGVISPILSKSTWTGWTSTSRRTHVAFLLQLTDPLPGRGQCRLNVVDAGLPQRPPARSWRRGGTRWRPGSSSAVSRCSPRDHRQPT